MSAKDTPGVETSGPIERIVWKGPFEERDCYGGYTGVSYVRCSDCSIEVLLSDKDRATHREGCRYA